MVWLLFCPCEEYLEVTAGDPARLWYRLLPLLSSMEPAPKRARVGHERTSFVFQCTTPQADGSLWRPKLLRLICTGDKNEVVCDESPPHGSWMQLPDMLTITFHHKGGANVKTSVFHPIEGTEAWLQVNCGAPWQGFLIPSSTGPLQHMRAIQLSKWCHE